MVGHYRSEMGYEAEDERERKREQERLAKVAARIKEDIEKRGIEVVLAEIVIDPRSMRNRYG